MIWYCKTSLPWFPGARRVAPTLLGRNPLVASQARTLIWLSPFCREGRLADRRDGNLCCPGRCGFGAPLLGSISFPKFYRRSCPGLLVSRVVSWLVPVLLFLSIHSLKVRLETWPRMVCCVICRGGPEVERGVEKPDLELSSVEDPVHYPPLFFS